MDCPPQRADRPKGGIENERGEDGTEGYRGDDHQDMRPERKGSGLDEPARQRGTDDGADEHDHKVGK